MKFNKYKEKQNTVGVLLLFLIIVIFITVILLVLVENLSINLGLLLIGIIGIISVLFYKSIGKAQNKIEKKLRIPSILSSDNQRVYFIFGT